MFLLIKGKLHAAEDVEQNFNTSHVSINQKAGKIQKRLDQISIHLMFLLICCSYDGQRMQKRISIHLMFLLIGQSEFNRCARLRYFNTSHVSINPKSATIITGFFTFQYISCFY